MARFTKSQLALSVAAALLAAGGAARAQDTSDLDVLLQAPGKQPYKWFASTDKKHKNDDYVLLKPGQTYRVPLAEGTLERLWSTSLFPDQMDLFLETGPHQKLPLLSNGVANIGFYTDKAFTLFPALKYESTRQLRRGAALVVVNRAKEPTKWFYQASVRPAPVGPLAQLPTPREISYNRFKKLTLAPGEEESVNVWDSPGLIYEFQVAVDGSPGDAFEKLRMRAAWDGQIAVDAPLMAIAGQLKGDGLVQNAVADFDTMALTLRWPMPFNKAQIWLRNTSNREVKLDVSARTRQYNEEPSPYRFCAVERTGKTEKGKPMDILDVKGGGTLAGLALRIQPDPASPSKTFAYLEGNETIKADDNVYEGTGNEDFFSSAWYFPEKPFYHPYEGLTFKGTTPPEIAAYRLMINDAIPFKNSLKFDFEQGNGNNRDDLQWQWVAFWYQKPPIQIPNLAAAPTAASGAGANLPGGNNLPIWLAPVGGVFVGIILYFSKKRRRLAKG